MMISINLISSLKSTSFKFSTTHQSNPQMPTRVPLYPKKIQPQIIPSSSSHFLYNPTKKIKISAKKIGNDAELASDLASQIEKLTTQLAQNEQAMKKSCEILLKEMCKHLEMKESEVRNKWNNLNEDDKLGLVKDFVLEWGFDFHPLSSKSVIEMVDKYLVEDNDYNHNTDVSCNDDKSSMLFSNMLKFLGFSQNK